MSVLAYVGCPLHIACNGVGRTSPMIDPWVQDDAASSAGLSNIDEVADDIVMTDASATAPEQVYRAAWKSASTGVLSYDVSGLPVGVDLTVRFHFVVPESASIGVYATTFKAEGLTTVTEDVDPWDFFETEFQAGSVDVTVQADVDGNLVVTADPDGAGIAVLCGFEILTTGPTPDTGVSTQFDQVSALPTVVTTVASQYADASAPPTVETV